MVSNAGARGRKNSAKKEAAERRAKRPTAGMIAAGFGSASTSTSTAKAKAAVAAGPGAKGNGKGKGLSEEKKGGKNKKRQEESEDEEEEEGIEEVAREEDDEEGEEFDEEDQDQDQEQEEDDDDEEEEEEEEIAPVAKGKLKPGQTSRTAVVASEKKIRKQAGGEGKKGKVFVENSVRSQLYPSFVRQILTILMGTNV